MFYDLLIEMTAWTCLTVIVKEHNNCFMSKLNLNDK